MHNEDKIQEIAWRVRRRLENQLDWNENKRVFTNLCKSCSQELLQDLRESGIQAVLACGCYRLDPDDEDRIHKLSEMIGIDTFGDEAENEGEDQEEFLEDPKYLHFWVETADLVVDICCDQFHPGEEEKYRVVLTSRSDPTYGKVT